MTQQLEIPVSGRITGDVSVPGSKSITNRALVLAAMADGVSYLRNALDSVDTKVAKRALGQLGVVVEEESEGTLKVFGRGGKFTATKEPIFIENAGTMARFLAPLLCAGEGKYTLDGNARMRERPAGELLDALQSMGCQVKDMLGTKCLPLEIVGGRLSGGQVNIQGEVSSQFVSALMLSAPLAREPMTIRLGDKPVSVTYIEMTRDVMTAFGVSSTFKNSEILVPAPQKVQPTDYTIESDASSASYFFAAAAVSGGRVKVRNMREDSIQGDLKLLGVLQDMGCRVSFQDGGAIVEGGPLKAVEVNMNTFSDMVPTLAAVAVFAEGTTRINDVENIRVKECDRISAVVTELRKIGVEVNERQDGLDITGAPAGLKGAAFDTYDDHRMAMALALIGLKVPGVIINDPGCVSKTFPNYFDVLFELLQRGRQ